MPVPALPRTLRPDRTTPVQFLPGVGPRRAALLEKLGVRILDDLLLHVPREYLDARQVRTIASLRPDELATVVGVIQGHELRSARGRSDLRLRVVDPTGPPGLPFFGPGFLPPPGLAGNGGGKGRGDLVAFGPGLGYIPE